MSINLMKIVILLQKCRVVLILQLIGITVFFVEIVLFIQIDGYIQSYFSAERISKR